MVGIKQAPKEFSKIQEFLIWVFILLGKGRVDVRCEDQKVSTNMGRSRFDDLGKMSKVFLDNSSCKQILTCPITLGYR